MMLKIFPGFFLILVLFISLSPFSHATELRITADELNRINGVENITILDTRNKNDYDIEHIKNAISFPVELTYLNLKENGKIQQPAIMQKFLVERGMDTNSRVIIYDEGNMIDSARLFWTLEVYGLKQVQILDQGYNFWRSKNFPVSQEVPKRLPSNYIATIKHNRLASKFTTQLAINNENKVVIDARSEPAYLGKTSVAKRFGHIPSALNVPFSHNIVQKEGFSGLKTIDELKSLYANIPAGKKVIIYCKVGRVSSTNYFALRELGHDVANYDASWREWGNDDSLPIVRISKDELRNK